MSHEVDNKRAMYARKPAWHGLGIVKEDGWFTADEALTALGMDEEVMMTPVFVKVPSRTKPGEFEFVQSEDLFATSQWSREEEKYRIHGAGMTKDYGVVQARTAFRFMDEVVGNIGGSHYECAVNLRKGRQTALVVNTGALSLDPEGRNDQIKKFILGTNSYDRSLAFRIMFTNIRVECANMLACALRGNDGKEEVAGNWTTKHTREILNRVEAAQRTLGLYKLYEDEWARQAELMIQTEMTDDTFNRLVKGLYEEVAKREAKEGIPPELTEKDRDAMTNVRFLYELGPANVNVYGTVWGGLQAVTEHYDWAAKVRGGRASNVGEQRLRRQMQDTGTPVKDIAWSMFSEAAKDNARKVVSMG